MSGKAIFRSLLSARSETSSAESRRAYPHHGLPGKVVQGRVRPMHTVIMVNGRFVRAADFEMAQVLSLKEALACEVIELHEAINALREDYENLALGYLSLVDRTSSDAQHGASASSKALQNEPDDQAWSALLGQGESVRTGWVRDGLLVSSVVLAEAWGRSRQALEYAAKRGELFSIKVGKNRFYPTVFARLEAEAVKAVCLKLKGEDAVAKFVFWGKKHGGLGGLTPSEAISVGQLDNVVRLAEAWSAERGLTA